MTKHRRNSLEFFKIGCLLYSLQKITKYHICCAKNVFLCTKKGAKFFHAMQILKEPNTAEKHMGNLLLCKLVFRFEPSRFITVKIYVGVAGCRIRLKQVLCLLQPLQGFSGSYPHGLRGSNKLIQQKPPF